MTNHAPGRHGAAPSPSPSPLLLIPALFAAAGAVLGAQGALWWTGWQRRRALERERLRHVVALRLAGVTSERDMLLRRAAERLAAARAAGVWPTAAGGETSAAGAGTVAGRDKQGHCWHMTGANQMRCCGCGTTRPASYGIVERPNPASDGLN